MQERLLWFLPPGSRPADRDSLRRAVLVVGGSLVVAAIAGTISAMQIAWGIPSSAIASGICALVALALPFAIRSTGRWRAAAVALVAAIWLPALAVGVISGGVMVASLYYLVLGAAIAAVTLGIRIGSLLGALNVVAVAAIYVAHARGAHVFAEVAPEVAMQSAMRGAFVFNLALAALVAAYELLRSAANRDSEENERRYRALADYGPDLIAELDSRGRLLHSSAGGAEIAGLLGGRSTVDGVHRDDRPALRDAVRLLETQPSIRVGPLRWLARSGEALWFEASLTRYRADKQQRILVVARDVSERIALEAQLRQSQKMQAVGQLGSGLAHDFNNLLMVVSGYAEVVSGRANGDPETLSAAHEIQRATEQGAALTRRLVGLSRPTPVARRELDLNLIARDSEKMLRVLLGEGIQLLLEIAPKPLVVSADAGELEQVLVNLVANARDALDTGGTVRIATTARGDRAALVVHDNGSGIEPALRERIFEPFFTTKRPGHGTGLGLYVVYNVISSLGGEVEVQSEPGAGTRVTLLLPLAERGARPESARSPRARAAGGTERILVVEDRPELRTLLRESLESAGYEVIVAADGVEALALNVQGRIGLVVTDIVMPRMGGVALVAGLREKRPELRALFISGNPGEPGRIDPRDRLMRKPFLIQDLRRAIREVLDAE